MKFCKNCGNQMDDQTVFCTNCGAKYADEPNANQTANQYADSAPAQPAGTVQPTSYPAQPYPPVVQLEPKPQPVSAWGFIGRSLIPLIPIVGTILYIVMLFVWSGDKTKEESFRNWAKSQLIILLITIILVIIAVVILVVFAGAFAANVSSIGNYY